MSNTSNSNINQGQNTNPNGVSPESKNSNKSQQDTLYSLCQALLRFINRKIVKKYIFPNEAQLPKEKRGLELRANNIWKYYLNKEVSEEEKIKDVFKDDNFLLSLQKMTNSLNEVTGLIESNQKKIKMMEERSRNKEEKINTLSEIRDLLNSFLKNNPKEESGENSKKDNKDNNINEDAIFNNIFEKLKGFRPLSHENSFENINNISNKKEENNTNTIKEEIHSVINNNSASSSEKNELDILINNFRLDQLKSPGKNTTEKDKENKEEIKNEIKDENLFLNKKTEREIKSKNNKNKNKKKKNHNKEKSENKENNINNNTNEEQDNSNIQKEKINLPILKLKEEKNDNNKKITETKYQKKEEEIEEEIINKILEDEIGENSSEINSANKPEEKKQKINIELLPKNNQGTEELFDNELRKHFSTNKKARKENNKIKELRNIINALEDKKIKQIKNYNERISGPYLSGSFKTFKDLISLNIKKEIDLVYKYKDMLLNPEVQNYTMKEVLENYLKLTIVKSTEIKEEEFDKENKVVKIEAECTSNNLDKNDIIKFNILFVDSGIGFNDKIIDELIMNKKEFLVKTEKEKFMNICLFLRLWRRKFHLFYLVPEILDEHVRKYFTQDKSTLNVILNVFYDLYNRHVDFIPKNKDSFIPVSKQLCEDIMNEIFNKSDEERIKDLQMKILKVTNPIDEHNFDDVFKM